MDVPAFAIADHQHAHVYVADSDDIDRVRVLQARPGSAAVLDGAEVLFNTADRFVKLKAARNLGKKMLGFRYTMDVIALSGDMVRGSHGRLPDDVRDAPVFLCSDASMARPRLEATDVRDVLLYLATSSVPVAR